MSPLKIGARFKACNRVVKTPMLESALVTLGSSPCLVDHIFFYT